MAIGCMTKKRRGQPPPQWERARVELKRNVQKLKQGLELHAASKDVGNSTQPSPNRSRNQEKGQPDHILPQLLTEQLRSKKGAAQESAYDRSEDAGDFQETGRVFTGDRDLMEVCEDDYEGDVSDYQDWEMDDGVNDHKAATFCSETGSAEVERFRCGKVFGVFFIAFMCLFLFLFFFFSFFDLDLCD